MAVANIHMDIPHIKEEDIDLGRLSERSKELFYRLKGYTPDEPISTGTLRCNLNGEIVALTYRQFELAKHLSNNMDPLEAYVRSGYSWLNRFSDKNRRNVNNIRKNLLEDFKRICLPKVTKMCNFLKKGPVEELHIDKVWLLNEQVTLYNITKSEKQYTTAARLLEQIATHVDVDAKATNRVSVESNVDYAAILAEAKRRTELVKIPDSQKTTKEIPDNSIESSEITKEVIEVTPTNKELH